jgi:hypothetical protein
MTIFTKRKDQRSPGPELCDRCRLRIGAVRVHFTAPTTTHLAPGERESWFCDECINAVRGSTTSN